MSQQSRLLHVRVRTGVVLIGVIGFVTACSIDRAPADKTMLDQFAANRNCFETIVQMAQAERGVERISPSFVRLHDNVMPTTGERRALLPDERWNTYKTLFRCAHVAGGIGIGSGVYFYAYDAGLAGSGQSKGYLWSESLTGRLVKTLDGPLDAGQDGSVDAFRHIDGQWYLEFSSS